MTKTPDWPPRSSASAWPEGHLQHGSTGQLWQVKDGRWERVVDTSNGWKDRNVEPPPTDRTHILVCRGPYSPTWTFDQRPPAVVHWFDGPPGVAGFYLSHGAHEDDAPFEFTHWRPFGDPP